MKSSAVITVIVFVWLLVLSFILFRQETYLSNHERLLSIQQGMVLAEVSRIWGRSPRHKWTLPQDNMSGVPQPMRHFSVGTLALYTAVLPSSELWVHFDANGRVDRTYFKRF